MKKIIFFLKELLATFWFLPVLIIGFAILLSMAMVSLDNSISISQEGWVRFFLVNSSDSARSILSTISGAMIGVAGTVFSVTLVALTLASSQFGPRLIKKFMYVRLNQIVLGSYISTYLYCLLVLNSVSDSNNYSFIPPISILVAILAAIANIILLIIFIHQIAVSIQADKVVSDISDFIARQVKALFPEKMGDELEKEDLTDSVLGISAYPYKVSIKCTQSGYIQYIDSEGLMGHVTKHNALLELFNRPGSFIVEGAELGVLYSYTPFEDAAVKHLIDQFVIGKIKTAQQDLEFSIHQMVEIAARALSPGVNDPFTAIACIDNLTSTMCYLAEAKFPSKYRFDKDNHLRIVTDALNFEGVLDAAFNQIRQFSKDSPAVIIRLMEALTTIIKFTSTEGHRKAVIKHAEMVLRLGEHNIQEKNDLEDLIQRADKILEKGNLKN